MALANRAREAFQPQRKAGDQVCPTRLTFTHAEVELPENIQEPRPWQCFHFHALPQVHGSLRPRWASLLAYAFISSVDARLVANRSAMMPIGRWTWFGSVNRHLGPRPQVSP